MRLCLDLAPTTLNKYRWAIAVGPGGIVSVEGFAQKVDTPKALANFSPGLELATTLGNEYQKLLKTLKALGLCAANPYRVGKIRGLGLPRVETTLG